MTDLHPAYLRYRFFFRVILPGLLAFMLFAGLIVGFLIPGFEKRMMEKKCEMIRELTISAISVMEYYHQQADNNAITADSAKKQSLETIRKMRYGDGLKDYFWITDYHPVMVMHPYRTDLEGHDLTRFYDPHGKAMFVEFVQTTAETGSGFVEYMWQWKDDSQRIVPKMSYVQRFEPWQWIVGTGVYIEDVKTEIARMEREALLISGAIGLAIMILLIFLTRQSFRIEVMRRSAEKELFESRERYKALAEVSSEGVLIKSSQGLHGNKALLDWLGYSETELLEIRLPDMVKNLNMADFNANGQNYESFEPGITDFFLVKKDGALFKVQSEISEIRMGDERALMMVFKPYRIKSETNKVFFSAEITALSASGFFQVSAGRHPKVIFATENTGKILGMTSQTELYHYPVNDLFADPIQRKMFFRSLVRNGIVNNQVVSLCRADKTHLLCIISARLINPETGEPYYECILEKLASGLITKSLLPYEFPSYSGKLVLDSPVGYYSVPVVSCSMNTKLAQVIGSMIENNTECMLVVTPENHPVGIITPVQLIKSMNQPEFTEKEAYSLMKAPVITLLKNDSIATWLRLLPDSGADYLVITDETGKPEGLIGNRQIATVFSTVPELFIREIKNACSITRLRELEREKGKLVAGMIASGAEPNAIVTFMSVISDAITHRIINLAIDETGQPPARFSFIQLGSVGRAEQTLLTDQDNGIIYENVTTEIGKDVRSYFLKLGALVNAKLHEAGYELCKGNIMAGNPRWCQPVSVWKDYFSHWIKNPGPEELLEYSIFFDFRHTFGDISLTDELRTYIENDLRTSDIFFHHLTLSVKSFSPDKQFHQEGITNLKKLMMPLTGIIRMYSLKYTVSSQNTLERLIELYQYGVFSKNEFSDILNAWQWIMGLRLQWQQQLISTNRISDNDLDMKHLNENGMIQLTESVNIIEQLLLKASQEFHVIQE